MLYRTFIESPDVASMLGIYPKTDSSHGYGSNSSTLFIKFLTKCIEISKKTPLTVTVLSECGLFISVASTQYMPSTLILFHGIGTKPHLAKTESKRELE